MIFRFDCVEDAADIMIHKGERVTVWYGYTWGTVDRMKTYERDMTMQMHLKDLLKMIEHSLRVQYRRNQTVLGGTLPTLQDISIVVEH